MNRLLRRQRAALALFIAFTVTGVGVALADPQSGAQPGVTVDVNPHPPYPGTQTVTVTGAGFQSGGFGLSGIVYQAATLPDGTTAVGLTTVPFTSNSQGVFQATLQVSPTFQASGSGSANFTVNCADPGVTCYVEATDDGGGFSARHVITFGSGTTSTTTTTVPPTTTTTVPPTTSTTVPPTTSTTVAPTTTTTVAPTTTTTVAPTTTTVVGPTTTTIVLPTTTTVPATTTTVAGGTTTTTVTGGPAVCAQIRTAQANTNTQINAAIILIQQSGLSPEQQATYIAQLEATRTAANAQFAQLLASQGCPS